MKQVICVNNFNTFNLCPMPLTLGKIYEVINEHNLSVGPGGGSPISVYDIIDDTGKIDSYNERYFQDNPQPTAAPTTYTHVPGTNKMKPLTTSDMLDAFNYVIGYDWASKNKECDHKWQHYVGIREEYDFCVTCDTKRDKGSV